ncbi:MAG: hypothetical protein LBC80_08515 [Treponema sp.]|jgi:tetratricopeptide (TPR) repeat protein|nr:hypothetical protein [Treponema sp.]
MINRLVKIIVVFTFIFSSAPLFAQAKIPWWLSLEYGKQRFRASDFGAALILFENARSDRRIMYEQMERDFIVFLSASEVRRIGDSLDILERFSYDRLYTAASAALEELFYRIPKNSFNNSATAALEAFEKLKNYPEAEFWIGEVYRIEGELPLALVQYRRALSMRDIMEDPGFVVTLQYKIASIHRTKGEFNEMERVLLSIVSENDTLWSDSNRATVSRINEEGALPYAQASASFARTGMTTTLRTHGIDRFLEMYRYNDSIVEQAHRLLGFHYVVSGRPSAEPHLMFAFLIQNTTIIEELRKRRFDFVFSDLPELIKEIGTNPLLLSYMDTVEYFKTAYYLGAGLFRNGYSAAALGLWDFLAGQPQAGEWHSRAVMQLRNPRQEPVIHRLNETP